MRKSDGCLIFLSACALTLGGLLVFQPGHDREKFSGRVEAGKTLVRQLALTDLCLFAEARYTRHPSQADYFSPFQDHPLAFDHFPSGSIVRPPAPLWKQRQKASGSSSTAP